MVISLRLIEVGFRNESSTTKFYNFSTFRFTTEKVTATEKSKKRGRKCSSIEQVQEMVDLHGWRWYKCCFARFGNIYSLKTAMGVFHVF